MPNIELKFSGETFAEVVDAALQFARDQAVDQAATLSYPIDEGLPTATPASDDPKVVYAAKQGAVQLDLEESIAELNEYDEQAEAIVTSLDVGELDVAPAEQIEDDGMVTVYPPITHEETATTDDVNAVEDSNVDSAGVKHDPRIHAENRAKKMDGTWKKKRGVKKETIEAVKSGEAGPAPVVHDTSEAYAHLLHCLSKAVQSGKFDLTQLNLMHQSLGVTNVQQLNGDPEKIAQAVMFIETVVNATSEGTE